MKDALKKVWAEIVAFVSSVRAWWNSDALTSKSIRIPFKLALVGGVAVLVLAFGLYGAKKVSAHFDSEPRLATAAQLTEFRSQIIAACAPPAPAAKTTKAKAKKTTKR